jgi:protein-S-isoprenylcysteine O-methyltransferase Ste14
MLFYLFCVGTGVLVVVGLYIAMKTKNLYNKGNELTEGVSLGYWILDIIHFLLVFLSSAYTIWQIPIGEIVGYVCGAVMVGFGVLVMLKGMVEFRSIRRISGLNNSKLVTTGIYRWSRNPQYVSWFLVLLGTSLIGRSWFALLYSTIGIILFHFYIILLEEPYLERIFGEKYLSYKTGTPRYFGIPKRKEKPHRTVVDPESRKVKVLNEALKHAILQELRQHDSKSI